MKERIVILGVVLMVASNHNDRDGFGCLPEHHQEALVVQAVVCVQIVSDISIYHQSMDLLLLAY